MGTFSEIATAATVHEVVTRIKALRDGSVDGTERRAFRDAILEALKCFEWEMPEWAKTLKRELEAEE